MRIPSLLTACELNVSDSTSGTRTKENKMNVFAAIVAGLVSTVVMTLLMMVAPGMGMPKMDIAFTIGSMMTADPKAARLMGMAAHFVMGVAFALIYAFVWSLGIGSVTWLWGAIFGVVHALGVALVGMPMMMRMHPRPPQMEGSPPMRMVGTLLGHVAFGIVLALTYAAVV